MGSLQPIPAPSPETKALLARVRGDVLPRYDSLGEPAFAVANGSRAMGFTDDSDLDITVVWKSSPPKDRLPALSDLTNREPVAASFEQPNFQVDRFWIDGQQLDVVHRSISDVQAWCDALRQGTGWQRGQWPSPVVAVSGLRYALPLTKRPWDAQSEVEHVPPALLQKTSQAARRSVESHWPALVTAAAREDGLLFHDLLLDPMHTLLVAYFAAHDHHYPFSKWLPQWLAFLGLNRDIAQLERSLWTTPTLTVRLTVFRALADLIFDQLPPDR